MGKIRRKLGDAAYDACMAMADRMQAPYEADPEDTGPERREARQLIMNMEEVIKHSVRRTKPTAN